MASHYKFLPPASGPQKVESYPTFADFPVTGELGIVYVDEDASDLYLWDGATYVLQNGGGTGDVIGPASSTDSGFARFDGVTGKLLKNSAATIVNADVSASAAIAYSKLNLATSIVNADVNASAAIALSKLAPTTANRALVSDGSGFVSASATTSTQIGYLSTLSGNVQTALDAKDTILDPAVNPDLYYIFQTDFTDQDRAGLTFSAAAGGGTGQAVSQGTTGINSTENCLGVIDCALGTGTTARITCLGSAWVRIGGQALDYGTRLAYSALSDGTDTYTTWIGFQDTTGTGIGTNGILFRYTHGTNSGKWQAVVNAAGVVTAADTGVAPSATVNQVFRIVVNQAASQVLFYIDGTLTNTVNSGLPATTATMFYANKIEKSAGTTSRTMTLDWLYFKSTRSSAR